MSSSETDESEWTNSDGSFAWSAIVGSLAAAWGLSAAEGVSDAVEAFYSSMTSQIIAVATFQADLMGSLLTGYAAGPDAAWSEAAAFASTLGPVGILFIAAEALVVVGIIGSGVDRFV
ncbi:hypothetical protein [Halocalculus aciditolerans]|uniref:Uncharacterized protein n=1 Tax=Halocalculus aciditolerans TaxID=1383812 RepID=A0A830FR68_9EURY|nr:hypothetical protein [Halocalculus aciditolerans]GGL73441.1 hypothetical protein GCM10009039_34430 [Halocalculus aciditolerans]